MINSFLSFHSVKNISKYLLKIDRDWIIFRVGKVFPFFSIQKVTYTYLTVVRTCLRRVRTFWYNMYITYLLQMRVGPNATYYNHVVTIDRHSQ